MYHHVTLYYNINIFPLPSLICIIIVGHSNTCIRSPPKMRKILSSRLKKNLELPGSPCLPLRPRSWTQKSKVMKTAGKESKTSKLTTFSTSIIWYRETHLKPDYQYGETRAFQYLSHASLQLLSSACRREISYAIPKANQSLIKKLLFTENHLKPKNKRIHNKDLSILVIYYPPSLCGMPFMVPE